MSGYVNGSREAGRCDAEHGRRLSIITAGGQRPPFPPPRLPRGQGRGQHVRATCLYYFLCSTGMSRLPTPSRALTDPARCYHSHTALALAPRPSPSFSKSSFFPAGRRVYSPTSSFLNTHRHSVLITPCTESDIIANARMTLPRSKTSHCLEWAGSSRRVQYPFRLPLR